MLMMEHGLWMSFASHGSELGRLSPLLIYGPEGRSPFEKFSQWDGNPNER